MHVYNPFAPQLTFPSDKTRLRRDHTKYLTLIKTVAFLHQYQRQVQNQKIGEDAIEYIEVFSISSLHCNVRHTPVLQR